MNFLAIDLGAGSGRGIVGTIANGVIVLNEVHRFVNRQVRLGNTLYWDFPALFSEVKQSIALAVQKGYQLKGIGVDTWGVDFGLLDEQGRLLSNPVCYRDGRTKGMLDEAFKLIDKQEFYSATGNQFMEINSVFQLLSMVKHHDTQLSIAKKLLFIPDLINYFLTGVACNEYTIASTSQLVNAQTRSWEEIVFNRLQLPYNVVQPIVKPCSVLGKLHADIAAETKATDTQVFAVGAHDTASAVAAIPANGDDWVYISSGTWSLMGVELDDAVMTKEAMANDFTNEGGVGGKIRFLRNITGLWLLQCLIKEWENEGISCDYNTLLAEALSAASFCCTINPDDVAFVNPQSMQTAIKQYCKSTHQVAPNSKGEYVRVILESLALKYKMVLNKLEHCTNKHYKRMHVVGGGCRNKVLNQFIADALGIEVIAGPVEATALGNIMAQAIACGELQSVDEGRRLIANSFQLEYYKPSNVQVWDEAFAKACHLL